MADESVVVVVEDYCGAFSVVEFSDLESFLNFAGYNCYIFEGKSDLGGILWYHEYSKAKWGTGHVQCGLDILKRDPPPVKVYRVREISRYGD